jgi:hypothetical protein
LSNIIHFVHYILFCSECDVALVIKYHFHDIEEELSANITEENSRKRKILQAPKRIVDYSSIKLPASMFALYLEDDCQSFMKDCVR